MADYTAKRIDDMEAIYLGGLKRARAELGVEAFGLAVIDLPPNLDGYPEHDHAESGQEEVFVVLRGGGEIGLDGERVAIDPDTIVRVGPKVRRKLWPGGEGLRVLAIGGVPGQGYEAPAITKLGEPDPMARRAGPAAAPTPRR
jgi:mannose-6-phosphate isomerase-like protein (cupin superfamily)